MPLPLPGRGIFCLEKVLEIDFIKMPHGQAPASGTGPRRASNGSIS
jgi:hypothetical protein